METLWCGLLNSATKINRRISRYRDTDMLTDLAKEPGGPCFMGEPDTGIANMSGGRKYARRE